VLLSRVARDGEEIGFRQADRLPAGHPQESQEDLLDEVRNVRRIADPPPQKAPQAAALPRGQLLDQWLRIGLQALSPKAPVHGSRANFPTEVTVSADYFRAPSPTPRAPR